MNLIFFFVMTPCIMIHTLKVGATVSCKILVNSYKIALCDIPYDCNYEVALSKLAFSFVSRCKFWWQTNFFSLCYNSPNRTQVASLLKFLDHTHLDIQAVSPPSTGILYGCLQIVTIPEAVIIQIFLLKMSKLLLETCWGL